MIPRQSFFVLWVLAAPVFGDTPDSAFAGIWRMVDVRPAPWAKPHPHGLIDLAIRWLDPKNGS